jgi:hypothetical protein
MKNQILYYAMSLPELLCVFVVLFFWMLSVYYFIKHFKKISTIERSGVYVTTANTRSSKPNVMKHDNTSIYEVGTLSMQNLNLLTNQTHPKQSFEIHADTCNSAKKLIRKSNQQNSSNNNQQETMQRACSEPVNILNLPDSQMLSVSSSIFNEKTFRANRQQNSKFYESTENMRKTQTFTTSKIEDPHKYLLNIRKTVTHDENLLNPDIIPYAVKKSLIDLHKKSALNLTHLAQQSSHSNLKSDQQASTNPIPRVKRTLIRKYKTQESGDEYV